MTDTARKDLMPLLRRLRDAGLVWPTLLSLAGLAMLVALGSWQLQRRAWKEALLRQIEVRAAEPPVTLAVAQRRHLQGEPVEYLRVRTVGRFLHDREWHFYAPYPPVKGWHVATPLQAAGGHLVMVNRGAVPEPLKDPAVRAAGQITGEVEVIGRVRLPEPQATFTPPDDVAKNIRHRRDPLPAIAPLARQLNLDPAAQPRFYLDAEALPANPGGWPRGGTTIVKPANRHLEYAITWFGLALTLAGVYAAFALARLRGA